MTAAEFRALKRRLDPLLRTWRGRLGLDRWDFTVNVIDGPLTVNGMVEHRAQAATETSWAYMNGTIDINGVKCAPLSDYELEGVVIHELIHCFFQPVREHGATPEMEERLVTELSIAFQEVRDGAREWGLKEGGKRARVTA